MTTNIQRRRPVTSGSATAASTEQVASDAPATDAAATAEVADADAGTASATVENDGDQSGDLAEARVLVAFDGFEVDDIVTAPERTIGQLQAASRVDPHPDAVAYVRSL